MEDVGDARFSLLANLHAHICGSAAEILHFTEPHAMESARLTDQKNKPARYALLIKEELWRNVLAARLHVMYGTDYTEKLHDATHSAPNWFAFNSRKGEFGDLERGDTMCATKNMASEKPLRPNLFAKDGDLLNNYD